MGSLYRRKWKKPDGSVAELPTWWLQYRQHGRLVRESSGTEKETVARRMLRTREGDVEKGIPINPKVGRVTFEEARADLLTDYGVNGNRSLDTVTRHVEKHLEPAFRGRQLARITTSTIRDYIASRQAEGASNATVNRELAALKRMFTLSVQAGKLHAKPYIPMLIEDNVRTGFFEQEQFESVRSHLPEALKPIATVAYVTGWRVNSEVVTLQWRQVDLRAGIMRLEPGATKNREGRIFPIGTIPDLLDALEAQRKATDAAQKELGKIVPYVFHRAGKPIKSFRKAWQAACRLAGCPGRIPHDFRRTAVRNLVRAGVPERTAMQLTGHKTRAVFDRYDIVDESDLRDATVKLGALLGTRTSTSDSKDALAAALNA